MDKKFLISGGGTGGHIIPAYSLANHFIQNNFIVNLTSDKRGLKYLDYFKNTIEETDSSGKKLVFIAQEMGREINTIGSKSSNSEMQKIVVEMKDELEKIKEQLLNIL